MDFPWVLIILFAAVFIAIAVFGALAAAKRRKELAEWAAGKGLTFSADRIYSLDNQYPEFACLSRGSNRYAYNTLSGPWEGRDFFAFDYHYETYSTDSKGRRRTNHHYFSAVVLGSALPLKPLTIRPEGFFDKIAEFFGANDIDFESAEFSRTFHVTAPDRRWAFDVLHARTIEFLMSMPRFSVQFDRAHVIAFKTGTFAPADFESAAAVVCGVLHRLPEYLVDQQRIANT